MSYRREQVIKCKKFYHFAIGRGLNLLQYRVFSHDVTAAILVSQNNETVAMLVSQVNPVGVELFSYECVTNEPQSQHLDLVNPYKRQMYLLVCGSLISRLFKNREIEDPRIMKNPREI